MLQRANKILPLFTTFDFWNSPVLNFKFDELDLFPSLNWIFTGCVACKNPLQTRKKFQTTLDFIGKNPVYQTQNFKLENVKNQVQINCRYGQLLLRMASLIFISKGKSCNASDQIYDILMMEKWNPKWNLIWKALGQHITSFSWPFFICLQAQCSASKCKCALFYNIFDQMSSFRWAICSKTF